MEVSQANRPRAWLSSRKGLQGTWSVCADWNCVADGISDQKLDSADAQGVFD